MYTRLPEPSNGSKLHSCWAILTYLGDYSQSMTLVCDGIEIAGSDFLMLKV